MRRRAVKALRFVLLALLLSLLVGLAIGTAIRTRLERPVVYLSACDALGGGVAGRLHSEGFAPSAAQ